MKSAFQVFLLSAVALAFVLGVVGCSSEPEEPHFEERTQAPWAQQEQPPQQQAPNQ